MGGCSSLGDPLGVGGTSMLRLAAVASPPPFVACCPCCLPAARMPALFAPLSGLGGLARATAA
eukprot:12819221-Alexandrium_andersonii.AAC.1